MYIPPSIEKQSFSCPYCGALAHQTWISPEGTRIKGLPSISTKDNIDAAIRKLRDEDLEPEFKKELVAHWEKTLLTKPYLHKKSDRYDPYIENVFFSECFSCKELAVWVKDKLVLPEYTSVFKPNTDLPEDIKSDFNEAATIFDKSPRGAAALLRLCIQKMTINLGKTGQNLNNDIAELVKDGLDPLIQKALDSVRVIGNEAVHPGEINLNDNRDIAESLFGLVNTIADRMISHPKKIQEIYSNLPAPKVDAIEKRDTPRKD